jgi:hypothetical protein
LPSTAARILRLSFRTTNVLRWELSPAHDVRGAAAWARGFSARQYVPVWL